MLEWSNVDASVFRVDRGKALFTRTSTHTFRDDPCWRTYTLTCWTHTHAHNTLEPGAFQVIGTFARGRIVTAVVLCRRNKRFDIPSLCTVRSLVGLSRLQRVHAIVMASFLRV